MAYMRFASVYVDFQGITDFERELGAPLNHQRRSPRSSR
jgi:transcriptional regulator NrdR family protein